MIVWVARPLAMPKPVSSQAPAMILLPPVPVPPANPAGWCLCKGIQHLKYKHIGGSKGAYLCCACNGVVSI